jgi:hypothetical protein
MNPVAVNATCTFSENFDEVVVFIRFVLFDLNLYVEKTLHRN